jgi:hypothetical protein
MKIDEGSVQTVASLKQEDFPVKTDPSLTAKNTGPAKLMLGKTFGLVTVLEILGTAKETGLKGRGLMVKGQCQCGNIWIGMAASLKQGNTKSCGCLPTGTTPNPANQEKTAISQVLSKYKQVARRRGLPWGLTDQEFAVLIKGSCYYCGSPPGNVFHGSKNRGSGKQRKTISSVVYNGVDRKNNDLGYVPDNVVSCCATCNYSKRIQSAEAFLSHVQSIYLKHFGDSR